jgi:peptidoglycan/xylan/chitin deacetylase (PgdA/CDA1 family)
MLGGVRLKIVMIRGKIVLAAVGILALAATVLITTAPETVAALKASKQLPIYCVKCEDMKVSLTFDAAWGNQDTQQIIDILNEYEVKATFFVVGSWAEKYPESVKALFEAGNEVMTHSNKHDHMTELSRDEIIADINESCDKIEKVTGVRPTLFRAPYGDYDDKVIEAVESMGMYTIQWMSTAWTGRI